MRCEDELPQFWCMHREDRNRGFPNEREMWLLPQKAIFGLPNRCLWFLTCTWPRQSTFGRKDFPFHRRWIFKRWACSPTCFAATDLNVVDAGRLVSQRPQQRLVCL